MTGTPERPSEDELHGWVDGQLPPERAAGVAALLAADAETGERAQAYAEQRRELRAALAPRFAAPIPPRLAAAARGEIRPRRRLGGLAQVAAGILLLALGGAGGWLARDLLPPGAGPDATARSITSEALAAYRVYSVEARHPVEVEASQEAHLAQWLSRRLGRPLVIPDLGAVGFKLMGGRLLPASVLPASGPASGGLAPGEPAAQFMYESDTGVRLTLYLRLGPSGETAFRYSQEGGVGTFYWAEDGFGYAIAAKADRDLLLKAAELVFKQCSDAAKPPAGAPPRPPGNPA